MRIGKFMIATAAVLLIMSTFFSYTHAYGREEIKRTVLFELFCSVNDSESYDDETAIGMLSDEYSTETLAVLCWFPPSDEIGCDDTQMRDIYYGIVNTPIAIVNGQTRLTGGDNLTSTYADYKNAIDEESKRNSPLVITASGKINETGAYITANFTPIENIVGGSIRTNFVIFEDYVEYKGKNNVTVHRYVVRKALDKGNPRVVISGSSWSEERFLEIDEKWNIKRLGAVIFVQADGSKEVYQSKVIFFKTENLRADISISPMKADVEVVQGGKESLTFKITNNAKYEDTIALYLSGMQSSWCSLSDTTVVLSPKNSIDLTVGISVPSDAQVGLYIVYLIASSSIEPGYNTSASIEIDVISSDVYRVSISPEDMTMSVGPGEDADFEINITNDGNVQDTYSLKITGDYSDWATLSKSRLSLAPEETEKITLTITVPEETHTGKYSVNLKVQSAGDANTYADGYYTVDVFNPEDFVRGVEISPTKCTETVLSGDILSYNFTVRNIGNIEDTYNIAKRGTASAWAVLSTTRLSMNAGESNMINVEIKVPDDASPKKYYLYIKVQSENDTNAWADAKVTLEVSEKKTKVKILSVEHTPSEPSAVDVVKITAKIDGEIKEVMLEYTSISGKNKVEMKKIGSGAYSATIGPFTSGETVRYKVLATAPDGSTIASTERSFTVKSAISSTKPRIPGFTVALLSCAFIVYIFLRKME